MSAWAKRQQEAVHDIGRILEYALAVEAEQGPVLADEMPELWEELQSFANAHALMQAQLNINFLPLIRRWHNSTRTFDFLRLAVRNLDVEVCDVSECLDEATHTLRRLGDTTFRAPGEHSSDSPGSGDSIPRLARAGTWSSGHSAPDIDGLRRALPPAR
mmetsp:Transcript_11213/g.27273  ORF Transcript_11213/g.27273 Transcript_11213/m.27273 type:complete len:159 (+) Transcript_11213:120-596(+)